jgi:hypothetical protein
MLTATAVELDLRIPKEELYECFIGEAEFDQLLEPAWLWYLHFLDNRIKDIWTSLLVPVIPGLSAAVAEDEDLDVTIVYEVLVVIAKAIKLQEEVSLEKIVSRLSTAGLVQSGAEDTAIQMAFVLSGWLTMLFDPKTTISRGQLQLRPVNSSRFGRGRARSTVVSSFSQDIGQAGDEIHKALFHRMLSQFGSLFPQAAGPTYADSMLNPGLAGNDNHLAVSYVCFNTLKNVGNLRIEWVNTLNLHLQLDIRKRVLRLYRFPSFCWLLYEGDDDMLSSEIEGRHAISLLHQLFADHKKAFRRGDPQESDFAFSEFCREVLLSYRLIFGIDGRSRRAFSHSAELADWGSDDTNDGSPKRSYKLDPLLQLLCTASPTEPKLQLVLARLRGQETSAWYALEDFPFLGRRLADLQRFSMGQRPYDWKAVLWYDRRDARNWWTMWTAWAVLIIGGGTLVLQFLQLFFQIWSTFPP